MAAIHLKLNILTYFLIGYKQVGSNFMTTMLTDNYELKNKK